MLVLNLLSPCPVRHPQAIFTTADTGRNHGTPGRCLPRGRGGLPVFRKTNSSLYRWHTHGKPACLIQFTSILLFFVHIYHFLLMFAVMWNLIMKCQMIITQVMGCTGPTIIIVRPSPEANKIQNLQRNKMRGSFLNSSSHSLKPLVAKNVLSPYVRVPLQWSLVKGFPVVF